MHRLMTLWLLLFITLAGAGVNLQAADNSTDTLPIGPSPQKLLIDKIEKDQIMDTASGQLITIDDIVAKANNTDVLIIGEAHDNYKCHTFQRDLIEALVKKYPKLIVGFEFFQRSDNPILDQWRNGQISETDLLKQTEWYKRGSQNYGYTRLIMDVIQKYKIKTIGLNIPRSLLRTVSRKGFENLSADEKKLFPTINIPNVEHEYFIKNIFGVFAVQVPMWFTNVYMAQKCWDVIMAESMRETLALNEFNGFKGVIIAGSNHVAYKLGIPFRYEKANPHARIMTIVPILLPSEKKKTEKNNEEETNPMIKMLAKSMPPASAFSRGIADVVFSAEQPLTSAFPSMGFSVEEKENQLIVTQVSEGSIAESNGIREGDRITAMDGVNVTTLEQLRLLIAEKNWGDSLNVGIIKTIDLKKEEPPAAENK
ncbi:MAG: ChaN family lipoprotein [Candidatus Omnitrophota bacterium]